MQEFIIMLLLERLSFKNEVFCKYLTKNFNTEAFNNRYKELLDNFLKPYALNKTEKSEEHD